MSEIIQAALLREKLYSHSITHTGNTNEKEERKKLKERALEPVDFEIFKRGLKDINKTCNGSGFAYLTLSVPSKNLYSIGGIEKLKSIQFLDISHNNLTNLKPLNALQSLITLNASHNKISKLSDVESSVYLQSLDLSSNCFTEIPDLHHYKYLNDFDISGNKISVINQSFSKNENLKIVNLSQNCIETIENLDNLGITELFLKENLIKHISGLDKMGKLRVLNLARNNISSLKGLLELVSLRHLHMADNVVKNIRELRYLENLAFLSVVDFCFNPIQSRKFYKPQVLYKLPQIRSLDGVNINPEEFVKSENFYGVDLENRKRIFLENLPEEQFVDRRLFFAELVDPETDSEEEDIKFIDQYDKEGRQYNKPSIKFRMNKISKARTSNNFGLYTEGTKKLKGLSFNRGYHTGVGRLQGKLQMTS